MLFALLASNDFAFDRAKKSSYPSMESHDHDPIPKSNPQHYQGSSDHALQRLQCLCNFADGVRASQQIRRLNGLLVRLGVRCQVLVTKGDRGQHGAVHHDHDEPVILLDGVVHRLLQRDDPGSEAHAEARVILTDGSDRALRRSNREVDGLLARGHERRGQWKCHRH